MLREKRKELATEKNVPAYVIFSDASLKDMTEKLPKTLKEFADISGVGKAKLDAYGEIFLKLIADSKPKKKKQKISSNMGYGFRENHVSKKICTKYLEKY